MLLPDILMAIQALVKMKWRPLYASGTDHAEDRHTGSENILSQIFNLPVSQTKSRIDYEEPAVFHEHIIPKSDSNTCPYCAVSLTRPDASFCSNCGASLKPASKPSIAHETEREVVKTIGKCMVCNLDVETDDVALWCPYCGNVAHKTHMLEWLHVKNYCPVCNQHLEVKDLSEQAVKQHHRKHKSWKRARPAYAERNE